MKYKDSMEGNNRDRQINVRVSWDEKEKISEAAKGLGMTIGQYIRWISIYSQETKQRLFIERLEAAYGNSEKSI